MTSKKERSSLEEEEKETSKKFDRSDDPRYEIPAKHLWNEMVIQMDRVQKVQREDTKLRYRCLIMGRNLKCLAGFGVGKASEPREATEAVCRMCKRNIFLLMRIRIPVSPRIW